MAFDAGAASGKYTLDISDAEKKANQLRKLFQGIKADADALGKSSGGGGVPALDKQVAAAVKAALAQQKLALAQQKTADVTNKASISAQRLATEQQKTATAITNTARADQQLAKDTANATAAQDRAAAAAIRRQQAEERAARGGGGGGALPRTFAGFTQAGLGQLAGLAGANFGIQALVNAGGSALSLRETQNSLQAITGNVQTYTRVLQIARQQQELFGGTLEENIQGLTGLTITSKQSGAQLEQLIDLSQRLAVLDPSQGAPGARIALSEALSGDPTSLAKRYEIPRAALAKLRDEGTSAAEKLLIIDQYLNRVGITSASVAGKIDQDALAFRRAKAEIEEATLKLGDYSARLAAIPARGITGLLDRGTVAPGAQDAGGQLQSNLVAQATSFEDYARRVRTANNEINAAFAKDPIAGALARQLFGLQQLTPAQFAYAQSLIATGTSQQQAIQATQQLADVSSAFVETQNRTTRGSQEADAAFTALGPKILQVAGMSDTNKRAVLGLLQAYASGNQSIPGFREALDSLARSHEIAAARAQDEARETNRLSQAFLNVVSPANAAASAIDGVAGAQRNLSNLRIDRNTAANLTGGIAAGLGLGAGQVSGRVLADQTALQASRDQLALARAKTAAERIAILQRQLGRQATEEGRNRILAQIEAEKQAGSTRVGNAQSTALQLANVEENSGLQLAKIQRENLERLRDQQEDFDVSRTRKREDYERKRISLLARGQRAEAARLADDFARDSQRDQEDFARQRRRTLRNNAEGTGDLDARTAVRSGQIQQRAALRGVGGSTSAGGGSVGSATGASGVSGGGRVINVALPGAIATPDGQTMVNIIWPILEVRIDDELSLAFHGVDVGQGQQAGVSGGRP